MPPHSAHISGIRMHVSSDRVNYHFSNQNSFLKVIPGFYIRRNWQPNVFRLPNSIHNFLQWTQQQDSEREKRYKKFRWIKWQRTYITQTEKKKCDAKSLSSTEEIECIKRNYRHIVPLFDIFSTPFIDSFFWKVLFGFNFSAFVFLRYSN